jgi:hypothetical protein
MPIISKRKSAIRRVIGQQGTGNGCCIGPGNPFYSLIEGARFPLSVSRQYRPIYRPLVVQPQVSISNSIQLAPNWPQQIPELTNTGFNYAQYDPGNQSGLLPPMAIIQQNTNETNESALVELERNSSGVDNLQFISFLSKLPPQDMI